MILEINENEELEIEIKDGTTINISSQDLKDIVFQIEKRNASKIIMQQYEEINADLPNEDELDLLSIFYVERKNDIADKMVKTIMELISMDLEDEKYMEEEDYAESEYE